MYEVRSATERISEHDGFVDAYRAWQTQPNPDDCVIVFPGANDE